MTQPHWTTTEPQEEGAYWFTGSANALSWLSKTGRVAPMNIKDSIVLLTDGGWIESFYMLTNLRGRWYGPLEPPEEA